ncbi:unnamed protein product [Linum tenue]|uniref:non-specific serine/threonine protein kinase n=1 Tax=Linum tenue TaxID=586396 RepID=A0AAV0JVG9_9ROSI|nr:unnamed protein product [Linum tenue]
MEPPPPPLDFDADHHSSTHQLNMDNLVAVKVLGQGAMGTVFLVHDRAASGPSAASPYALKVVDKAQFLHSHSRSDAERRARWEIRVLTRLARSRHPFLPRLVSSAETPEFLAWALPFCPGGDLNVLRHRQNDRVFSPAAARFYLAEILCALEHLHELGIVYRDLKPENILIQQSGHVTLTDFDLSRFLGRRRRNRSTAKSEVEIRAKSTDAGDFLPPRKSRVARWWMPAAVVPVGDEKGLLKKTNSARIAPVSHRRKEAEGERSNSFVGTEEYVSPEVVRGEGHEFAVDWWALGVLLYEMVYGTTPFKGRNRKETFRNVLMKRPEFVGKLGKDLTDLIERLLEKDPAKRLGYADGAAEIKGHAFFKGVRWDLLTEVCRPPFIPSRDETEGSCPGMMPAAAGGVDIREYFEKLRAPPVSPLWSPSSEFHRNVSLAEF